MTTLFESNWPLIKETYRRFKVASQIGDPKEEQKLARELEFWLYELIEEVMRLKGETL